MPSVITWTRRGFFRLTVRHRNPRRTSCETVLNAYRAFGHVSLFNLAPCSAPQNDGSQNVRGSCASQRAFYITDGEYIRPFIPYSIYQFTCQMSFIPPIPGCVVGLFHPEVSGYFLFYKAIKCVRLIHFVFCSLWPCECTNRPGHKRREINETGLI